MAKESFLKKDKAAAEKFTRALYKAQQWVDTHSQRRLLMLFPRYLKTLQRHYSKSN